MEGIKALKYQGKVGRYEYLKVVITDSKRCTSAPPPGKCCLPSPELLVGSSMGFGVLGLDFTFNPPPPRGNMEHVASKVCRLGITNTKGGVSESW